MKALEQNAVEWFIDRFIDSKKGKRFARRLHGLDKMTPDETRKLRHRRYQFAAWDFHITSSSNAIHLSPNTAAASWVTGFITLVDNEFVYTSLPRTTLFNQLDKVAL